MAKKKAVTYFKTISFTITEGNENMREVDQVDRNSPKTRLEKTNKREEERKKKYKIIKVILDFKLSPCFESCMYSFGYFSGVRLWFADVSEPSISSIFKGWM